MKHKRNTEGLAIAAKQRRERTIQRVNEAISVLLSEKKTINFNSVSKTANVGKTWLYKENNIREKIQSYREQKSEKKQPNKLTKITGDSKDALIAMLKNRVQQVEAENRELKKQIEILYGQVAV